MALRMTLLATLTFPLHTKAIFTSNYSILTDAIPQLVSLTKEVSTSPPTWLGGRNMTHCCLLAVNESFSIQNGSLVQANSRSTFLDPRFSIFDLENALQGDQFLCGAKYNGDHNGAPIIRVGYNWCKQNCGGWQVSSSKNLRQWIGPMVGFILPSLVFCLNVPRRRKLLIGDRWFKAKPGRTYPFLKTPLRALVAAVLVAVDTLIWLCICFAAAGPMLLSGIYEATLDSRILSVVGRSLESGSLTTEMRARLLLIDLVGNFDLRGGDDQSDTRLPSSAEKNAEKDPQSPGTQEKYSIRSLLRKSVGNVSLAHFAHRNASVATAASALGENPPLNTWDDVDRIVRKIGIDPYKGHSTRIQAAHDKAAEDKLQVHQKFRVAIKNIGYSELVSDPKAVATTAAADAENAAVTIQQELDATIMREGLSLAEKIANRDRALGRVKTRLRSMMEAQNSFGSTVGAPVVFFAGAFIYNIADTLSALGDNNTALAFGMWWLIIPYLAIVAGLLLGANNPRTFEGIAGKEASPGTPFLRIFALSFPSKYKTEWMWFRGRSKRQWIERVLAMTDPDSNLEELRRRTRFSFQTWCNILGTTLVFIAVPFTLAFVTAYFTPLVGISCRSLTFLVYALLQVSQLILWVWVLACSETDTEENLHSPTKRTEATWTSRNGKTHQPRLLNTAAWLTWWALAIIFGIASVFTAVGGTMMQIMGVYGNCFCALPIQYWYNERAEEISFPVSSNTKDDIAAAVVFWKGLGGAAVGILCLTCYIGWWYQRRLRFKFGYIAEHIEGVGS